MTLTETRLSQTSWPVSSSRVRVYCRQRITTHSKGLERWLVFLPGCCVCHRMFYGLETDFRPMGGQLEGSWCIEKPGHGELVTGFISWMTAEQQIWRSPLRSCWSSAEFKWHIYSATAYRSKRKLRPCLSFKKQSVPQRDRFKLYSQRLRLDGCCLLLFINHQNDVGYCQCWWRISLHISHNF